MPEDGLGFRFFATERGNIANDRAVLKASDALTWERGTFPAGEHFDPYSHIGRAIEAVQRNIEDRNLPDPQWEDNVPPGVDDFVL